MALARKAQIVMIADKYSTQRIVESENYITHIYFCNVYQHIKKRIYIYTNQILQLFNIWNVTKICIVIRVIG